MAYRILSAAVVACLAGLSAAPASAGTVTSQTDCYRVGRGAYECTSKTESARSETTTRCFSTRGNTDCNTETTEKKRDPTARIPIYRQAITR